LNHCARATPSRRSSAAPSHIHDPSGPRRQIAPCRPEFSLALGLSSIGLVYREIEAEGLRAGNGVDTDVSEGLIAFQLSIKPE